MQSVCLVSCVRRDGCRCCSGPVRSWFSCERVLRVQPRVVRGGFLTVAEMYLESCASVEGGERMECPTCLRTTEHESQSRIATAPNILVVQMRRIEGARPGVDVEMQLELPGLPVMELVGVMYHDGRDFNTGHYTCLCPERPCNKVEASYREIYPHLYR